MLRLRLRVASSGVTHKLELPAGCSWEGLQNAARQAVGLNSDVHIVLSLNKKTPVAGTPTDTLNSLGVCGGDLFWLLAPDLPEGRMDDHQPKPTNCKETSRQATIASSRNVQLTQSDGLQRQGACDSGSGMASGPDNVRMEESPDERRSAGDEASALPGERSPLGQGLDATYTQSEASSSAHPGVSLKLRRLLMGGGTPSNPAAPPGTSSFTWGFLSPATRCLLLLDCAMAEGGFESMQDLLTLAATHPTAFPRQLLYTCSLIPSRHNTHPGDQAAGNDAGSGGHGRQTGTEAEPTRGPVAGRNDIAMLDAGDTGTMLPNGTVAAAVAASGALSTAASARVAEPPVAKLLWYCMGRYLVVHSTPCRAPSPSPSIVVAAAAPVVVTASTLHIDLTEYGYGVAQATAGGNAQSQPQPPSAAATVSPLMLPRDAAAHWRQLKDGLVLPLLVATCRVAGLAPPLGLTVLPLELQMSVMRRLQPRDLAIVGCTCSALHRLAAEDELWRPLFEREFLGVGSGSGPSSADLSLANTRGYKYVFGMRWRDRAKLQRRRQMFRPGQPPLWTPPPPAPFIRPPFMPPGSIGGDYDRLPGPLMGFGPGRLGAGPGLFGGGLGTGPFRGGAHGGMPGPGQRPGRRGGGGLGGGGGGFFI